MNVIPPQGFPYKWCSASGDDKFGLWLEFTIKGMVQRMRWVAPGSFSMGSPFDELHRHPFENRHEVIISRGFWMADTACTQQVWQCVMDKNPSSDHHPGKPVVNISWNDCNDFLARLRNIAGTKNFAFPTEAQWEFACRAGTTDPFYFGITITPEQVNYNGEYPYFGEMTGLNRGKTVEVGTLPPNNSGLYEMHGNIWEWCSDWYGDYETGKQTDPVGPAEGKYRVLRGGSAYSGAGDCRSAARSRCHSDGCYNRNGFRIVWNPLPLKASTEHSEEEMVDNVRSIEDKKQDEYVIIPEKKELVKP